MEIIYLITGLSIGFFIAALISQLKTKKSENEVLSVKSEFEKTKIQLDERISYLQNDNEKLSSELKETEAEKEKQAEQFAKTEEKNTNLQEKLASQKQEMEELQKKFTTEFENIAHKILKQNSQEFTQTNQKNISEILTPLKEKIQIFEKKVEDTYEKGLKDQTDLKAELKKLHELNLKISDEANNLTKALKGDVKKQGNWVEDTYEKGLKDQTDLKAELKKLHELNLKISDEANNLTKALKGDVKKQGNWGEVILERILERSGLTEGREYEKQFSTIGENGSRIQPDVVINLPDQKHIIVDSKVSLIAYERFVNATDDDERQKHIKDHLLSIKTHIKGLSEKHYQNAQGVNSPDFVLLFVPIESSFSVAIEADQELFSFAWDNKVVIVSPSTLLATLRTIASIWQQENQTRNAIEIARQGGALYDKFVNFIIDLEKIGNNLDTTRKNYDLAMNKLNDGRGNLVRSAEKLRELGAKASKELPQKYLEE